MPPLDADSTASTTPAATWTQRDQAAVWHPFTPMRTWEAATHEPGRVIVAGEGFELIDDAGRRYLDGFSSLWCNLHGHQVPAIDNAIREQLARVAHTTLLGHASPPSIELAERLLRLSPAGLEKVFYSDSGASAVEVALKMAYQYFRNRGPSRTGFLALRDSYHGDTIGSVSLGGIDTFHRIFHPLLFETTLIDSPNPYHHPKGPAAADHALDQLEAELAQKPDHYCAMIVEPLMQGAAGMLSHPAGFLRRVRELTKQHGVLLIVDEVATGFGSTGKLFACEHEAVSPDLMTLGKRLTNGYLPVSATLATQEIYDAFLDDPAGGESRTFYHGHTFTGNALGCAAAVASLDLLESSGLLATLPDKTRRIQARLERLASHPHVGSIRQQGLMVGVELVETRGKTSEPPSAQRDTPFDPARRIGAKVCLAARERGILIRPLGDVVVLMPAPGMDVETLETLLEATIETIETFFANMP